MYPAPNLRPLPWNPSCDTDSSESFAHRKCKVPERHPDLLPVHAQPAPLNGKRAGSRKHRFFLAHVFAFRLSIRVIGTRCKSCKLVQAFWDGISGFLIATSVSTTFFLEMAHLE